MLNILPSCRSSTYTISNISSINDGILKLTGGITFYNADVRMENVDLSDGFDEDLLNIVNSKYNLNNLVVSRANSDAIDFDFSEGKIDNIELSNIILTSLIKLNIISWSIFFLAAL